MINKDVLVWLLDCSRGGKLATATEFVSCVVNWCSMVRVVSGFCKSSHGLCAESILVFVATSNSASVMVRMRNNKLLQQKEIVWWEPKFFPLTKSYSRTVMWVNLFFFLPLKTFNIALLVLIEDACTITSYLSSKNSEPVFPMPIVLKICRFLWYIPNASNLMHYAYCSIL